jgi:ABC-type uncharacterized transport system YnjBCD substrate-binding protein
MIGSKPANGGDGTGFIYAVAVSEGKAGASRSALKDVAVMEEWGWLTRRSGRLRRRILLLR